MVAKFKKIKKGSSGQNIFFSVLIGVLFLFLIGFLIFTNLKINRKRVQFISQIESIQKEIQILEQKKAELQEKIAQAGSKDYLEKVAREQLGLKKPGEGVIVITKEDEEKREEEEEKSLWDWFKFWER